jgi:methionyl-tRNA formyltransferase
LLKLETFVFLTGLDKSNLLAMLAEVENVISVIMPFRLGQEERLRPVIEISRQKNISVHRPKRSELAAVLREIKPDALVSAGYPYLLSAADLAVAKVNLNIHPTLLPKYRGKLSGWHIIANGEGESGVTIHYMSPEMDRGNILSQRSVALSSFDTVASMARKTAELEAPLLMEAIQRVRQGDSGRAQDESVQTTFAKLRTPEDSRIDPSKTLLELYNVIRACDPKRYPAFFDVEGQRVGIQLFRLEKPSGEDDLL